MNLEGATLVPFRTKGKLQDGTVVVFAGRTTAGRYRFIPHDCLVDHGSFHYKRDGSNENLGPEKQLVQIGRPWSPTPGQPAIVCGFALRTSGEAFTFNYADTVTVVRNIPADESSRDLRGMGWEIQYMGITMNVHRNQLSAPRRIL